MCDADLRKQEESESHNKSSSHNLVKFRKRQYLAVIEILLVMCACKTSMESRCYAIEELEKALKFKDVRFLNRVLSDTTLNLNSNLPNLGERNAMFWAIKNDNTTDFSLVRTLIKSNLDPNVKDEGGWNAFELILINDVACKSLNVEILHQLFYKMNKVDYAKCFGCLFGEDGGDAHKKELWCFLVVSCHLSHERCLVVKKTASGNAHSFFKIISSLAHHDELRETILGCVVEWTSWTVTRRMGRHVKSNETQFVLFKYQFLVHQ